jgi:leader peptidase (prepilin peptidase)/N-methyltransferase
MRAAMPALDWTLLLRTPAFEVTAFLMGLVVGSFANVCIHRLAQDYDPAPGRLGWLRDVWRQVLSLVHPPSHCPRCGRPVRPWDNVPLLSWALLRGRCRDCRVPIPARYPLVEAANGALWLAIAVLNGPRPRTVAELAFASAVLVLVLVDLEHQILPDLVTLGGTLLGVAASLLPGSPVSPVESIAAAAGGYLAFAALAWYWRRLRGIEALGEGDWKMAAMLGAFLGWQSLLLTVLLASLAGSVVGIAAMLVRRGGWQSRLPLGSFLGIGALVVLFFGRPLLGWYAGLFNG